MDQPFGLGVAGLKNIDSGMNKIKTYRLVKVNLKGD